MLKKMEYLNLDWVLDDIRKLLPILLCVIMTLWLCFFFKFLTVKFFLKNELLSDLSKFT